MSRVVVGIVLLALTSCLENQHPVATHTPGADRTDVLHEAGGGSTDRPAAAAGGDRRGGKH